MRQFNYTALKFLLLFLSGALSACGKEELAPVPSSVITRIGFECPVPESLRGKVVAVRLPAERVGESPEKGQPDLEGSFAADSVGLTLPGGSNISIQLDEPMGFIVKSQALHTGRMRAVQVEKPGRCHLV